MASPNIRQFENTIRPPMAQSWENDVTMAAGIVPIVNLPENASGGSGRNSNNVLIKNFCIGFRLLYSDTEARLPQVSVALVQIPIYDPRIPVTTPQSIFSTLQPITANGSQTQLTPFGFLKPSTNNCIVLAHWIVDSSTVPTNKLNTLINAEVKYAIDSPSGSPPIQNNLFLYFWDTNVASSTNVADTSNSLVNFGYSFNFDNMN